MRSADLLSGEAAAKWADGFSVLTRLLLHLQQLSSLDDGLQSVCSITLIQVVCSQPLLHLSGVVPERTNRCFPQSCWKHRLSSALSARTLAACRCSMSTHLCVKAGCWEWQRWCSGRAAAPPDPQSRDPNRDLAWCHETVPAGGSGPLGCRCWAHLHQYPCWMNGSCIPLAWPLPDWECSHSPTWPALDRKRQNEGSELTSLITTEGWT